jgi:hypothetical protein
MQLVFSVTSKESRSLVGTVEPPDSVLYLEKLASLLAAYTNTAWRKRAAYKRATRDSIVTFSIEMQSGAYIKADFNFDDMSNLHNTVLDSSENRRCRIRHGKPLSKSAILICKTLFSFKEGLMKITIDLTRKNAHVSRSHNFIIVNNVVISSKDARKYKSILDMLVSE